MFEHHTSIYQITLCSPQMYRTYVLTDYCKPLIIAKNTEILYVHDKGNKTTEIKQ